MRFLFVRCLCLFSLIILFGCGKVNIEVPYYKAARQQISLKTSNIAILPPNIRNSRSMELTLGLSAAIEGHFLEGEQFKPVDLSSKAIQTKLIEASLKGSTGFNDAKILQLGKHLNVSLMIIPRVTCHYKEHQHTRNRTVRVATGHYRIIVDANGHRKRVAIYRNVTVKDRFQTRTISLSSQVKMVNVETGAILSSSNKRALPSYHSEIMIERGSAGYNSGVSKIFQRSYPTVHRDEQQFFDDFLTKVKRQAVNEISPVLFHMPAKIYDSGDLEKGYRYAKLGNWQLACDLWERVLSEDANNYKCLVNLAASYLALDDVEKSNEYLQRAYEIEDDDDILSFSNKVSQLHQESKKK